MRPLDGIRVLGREVLNAPWRVLDIELPTHLSAIHRAFGSSLDLSVDELLLQHTMFAVYAAGMTEGRRSGLYERLLRCRPGPTRAAIPSNQIERFRASTFHCVACDNAARREWGTRYLSQANHCFGVRTCAVHGLPLNHELNGHSFDLLDRLDLSMARIQNDAKLAASYRSILGLNMVGLAGFRQHILSRAGFDISTTSRNRSTHCETIAATIQGEFRSGFTSGAPSSIVEDMHALTQGVARFVSDRFVSHPFWAAILHASLPSIRTRHEQWSRPEAHPGPSGLEIGIEALRSEQNLTRASQKSSVSVTTLSIECRRRGLPFSARPSKLTQEVREGMLLHLAAGVRVDAVAALYSLSLISAYRVLRACVWASMERESALLEQSRAERRARWSTLLLMNPGRGVKALRLLSNRDWTWLYRNDRGWLSETLVNRRSARDPSNVRKRRASSADSTERQLKETLTFIREVGGREPMGPKQTATFLLKQLGLSGSGSAHSCLARKVAEQVAESDRDYVLRRLAAGLDLLLFKRITATPANLLRASRIRPETATAAPVDVGAWLKGATSGARQSAPT